MFGLGGHVRLRQLRQIIILIHMSIDVGARLKHVRELHGLSQRELARRAGVTNGLISLIEQNRVSPSVGSLKKVLDGVPMSMAEFFTLDVTSAAQVFYAAERAGRDRQRRRVAAPGGRAAPGPAAHRAARAL